LKATIDTRDNRIALGLSDLRFFTHHQTSLLACGSFHRVEDRDLSGIGSLLSASFRTRSSRHWIFRLWSFLHHPSQTKGSDTSCWGVRAFMMTINKSIPDQKRCTRSQSYHKTIHTEHQNLREKLKQEKITESLANPLLSRDCMEKKENLTTTLYNSSHCFI